MHITLHLTVLMTSVHTPLLTEWSLVFRSEGGVGGGSAGRESGPSDSVSPSSPHRRKQGRYNLFSWLSMKVRGRGTRACVCLALPPRLFPQTPPPTPTVYFFGPSCQSRHRLVCPLHPSPYSLIQDPSAVALHRHSPAQFAPHTLLLTPPVVAFSHIPLFRVFAAGSVASRSDYYYKNY